MKTLLIDNYDSFTYNLFQLLAEANGEEPTVVRNGGATWAELAGEEFDNVVVSPGPGTPANPKDFGVCADAIRESEKPLLGVCLGHQGIGHFTGGQVVHAQVHGRQAPSTTTTRRCSRASPRASRWCATTRSASRAAARGARGHGLDQRRRADGARPPPRPIWGVQFHPSRSRPSGAGTCSPTSAT